MAKTFVQYCVAWILVFFNVLDHFYSVPVLSLSVTAQYSLKKANLTWCSHSSRPDPSGTRSLNQQHSFPLNHSRGSFFFTALELWLSCALFVPRWVTILHHSFLFPFGTLLLFVSHPPESDLFFSNQNHSLYATPLFLSPFLFLFFSPCYPLPKVLKAERNQYHGWGVCGRVGRGYSGAGGAVHSGVRVLNWILTSSCALKWG